MLCILGNCAPNFEKVEGAYCFRLVRQSVKVQDRVLKFHRWTPHQKKIADPNFFNLDYLPLWSYALLKGHNEIL